MLFCGDASHVPQWQEPRAAPGPNRLRLRVRIRNPVPKFFTNRREFVAGKLVFASPVWNGACVQVPDVAVRSPRLVGAPADRYAPIADWREARARLRRAVLRSGFRRARGCFTRSLRGDATNAIVLALPATGLLPPRDPRVLATLERVQVELGSGALVHRYRVPDGLDGGEGAFVLCSSWLIGALALAGRVEQAERLFEQLAGHVNDVGLLAEEIDPDSTMQLGNFPQGLSHVALIEAAVHLSKAGESTRREAA